MNVRRTLILAVTSAVALVCLRSPAQDQPPKVDVPNKDVRLAPAPAVPGQTPGRDPRGIPQAQPIQKPADPARVRATYEMNGARVPITEGDFYDTHQRLEKLEPRTAGRALDVNRVYEHILAFAEAKGLGLEATPEEVALFDPLAANADLATATWARYDKEGVTRDMYATYQRETRSIQKAKDLFANSMRILSSDVFEAYRRDHFSFRLEFVEFPASKYAEELKQKPPTDQELKAFWDGDKGTQNRYRSQPTVTAEFVSFDPRATTSVPSDREVPRAEALAYYNQNKARLDTILTPEQRASLNPTGKVEVSELKTPFQMLRPVIEREIRLSGKIRAAFEEAKKPGSDFSAIASKAGLNYERVDAVDREKLTTQYARYGLQIFSVLSNHNPGEVSPDLKIEPQLQFFYRLIAEEASKLPDFDSIKAKLIEPYIEATSLKGARDAAQAMRSSIDQKVDAEIRSEEEKMLGEAQAAAEAEGKTRGVTDPKEIEAIRARHKATTMAKIRQMKDGLASKHFDAYVKDNGLKVRDTGLFEAMNPKRDMGQDPASRVLLFIKTNPQIKTMEPGQVTQVMTDAGTKTQIIARMAERSEPDYATMTDGDLLAIRAQKERAISYQPIQRWQFNEISRRRELKIE